MPRGYKAFFMLNSTEHKISTTHKTKTLTKKFLALSLSDVVFVILMCWHFNIYEHDKFHAQLS